MRPLGEQETRRAARRRLRHLCRAPRSNPLRAQICGAQPSARDRDADQPSVALTAPSSTLTAPRGPNESAQPWARAMLARAPSPTISLCESDPSSQPGSFSTASCSRATIRRATPAGRTGGQRSRRSHARCVGQGCLVGGTAGPLACSAAVRERRRSREEGWGTLPESRRLPRTVPEASTASVSWLPTTYPWSKRFSGLHSLLVSPRSSRLQRPSEMPPSPLPRP